MKVYKNLFVVGILILFVALYTQPLFALCADDMSQPDKHQHRHGESASPSGSKTECPMGLSHLYDCKGHEHTLLGTNDCSIDIFVQTAAAKSPLKSKSINDARTSLPATTVHAIEPAATCGFATGLSESPASDIYLLNQILRC